MTCDKHNIEMYEESQPDFDEAYFTCPLCELLKDPSKRAEYTQTAKYPFADDLVKYLLATRIKDPLDIIYFIDWLNTYTEKVESATKNQIIKLLERK